MISNQLFTDYHANSMSVSLIQQSSMIFNEVLLIQQSSMSSTQNSMV